MRKKDTAYTTIIRIRHAAEDVRSHDALSIGTGSENRMNSRLNG